MSSILKALRKIEEEKRVNEHAAPDLRGDQGTSSVKTRPFLPLLAGIAFGAIFVGLFFFWISDNAAPVDNNSPNVATKSVDPAGEQVSKAPDIEPSKPVVDSKVETPPKVIDVPVVVLPPEPVHIEEPRGVVATETVEKPSQAVELVQEPAPISASPTEAPVSLPVEEVVASSVVPSDLPEGVSLLVEEIFYQEDSVNSMAVVNDLPVMVGTHVGDAVVTTIYPDRVLFKIGNNSYVVVVTSP